jgi:hypothetical protein
MRSSVGFTGFVQRDRRRCPELVALDDEARAAVYEEWELLLDFRAGPRSPVVGASGEVVPGRFLGRAMSVIFGRTNVTKFADERQIEKLKARTKRVCGLTDKEVLAVAVLEAWQAKRILREWRKDYWQEPLLGRQARRYVEHAARMGTTDPKPGPYPASALLEPWEMGRGLEQHRKAHKEEIGSTRPKEFWHEAVRTLRSEAGLLPREILELAREFRDWGATEASVKKALIAAAPARRLPRTSKRPRARGQRRSR